MNQQRYRLFKKRTAVPMMWGVRPFGIRFDRQPDGGEALLLEWTNTDGRKELVSIDDDGTLERLAAAIARVQRNRAKWREENTTGSA